MTRAPAPAAPRERPLVWHRTPHTRPGTFRYSVTRSSAHQLERFDGQRWAAAKAPNNFPPANTGDHHG